MLGRALTPTGTMARPSRRAIPDELVVVALHADGLHLRRMRRAGTTETAGRGQRQALRSGVRRGLGKRPLRRAGRSRTGVGPRNACRGTVQPAHSHRSDLTRPLPNTFTEREMRCDLLIGIVIVVLIERARMRPGG